MQDNLLNKIDSLLYFEAKTIKKPPTELESKLNKCFNIITEDIDQYLKIINKPWSISTDKLMNHLRTISQEELIDWVDALKIMIIDRGMQNRWLLSLVQATKNLPLSEQMQQSVSLMFKSIDGSTK